MRQVTFDIPETPEEITAAWQAVSPALDLSPEPKERSREIAQTAPLELAAIHYVILKEIHGYSGDSLETPDCETVVGSRHATVLAARQLEVIQFQAMAALFGVKDRNELTGVLAHYTNGLLKSDNKDDNLKGRVLMDALSPGSSEKYRRAKRRPTVSDDLPEDLPQELRDLIGKLRDDGTDVHVHVVSI